MIETKGWDCLVFFWVLLAKLGGERFRCFVLDGFTWMLINSLQVNVPPWKAGVSF